MKKLITNSVLGKFFYLPNTGLKAYLNRVRSGNFEDYRTPFYDKVDRNEIMSKWQRIFDNLHVNEDYPDLYAYEMEMKAKVGPLSIMQPLINRLPDIDNYYSDINVKSSPISKDAISECIKFFNKARGVNMKSESHVVNDMTLNTNSGSPYFTRRNKVINQTLSSKVTYCWAGETWQDSKQLCAILGWRGQEGGPVDEDVKQRVVWMMPFLLNIKELQVYQPVIQAFQYHNLIPAYVSMDAVDREVTYLFDTKGKDDLVICTDFSRFDQHFNQHMQDAAKSVLTAILAKGCEEWLNKVFPIKYNIPLLLSDNWVLRGPHGMGSGSGGTNLDECLAHKCLQFECAISNHAELNKHSMAYGDDGCLTYPGITVDQIVKSYSSHGQECNTDKQYASKTSAVVLRRIHMVNYRKNGIMVGIYSTFRALGRLMGQERYYDPKKWSKEMVELRYLSILENCKWSPYFHEFIDFCIEGDKYRLGIDIPGFFENLQSYADKATDLMPDFLGYTKSLQPETGIMQWEVVKYLMSKKHKRQYRAKKR